MTQLTSQERPQGDAIRVTDARCNLIDPPKQDAALPEHGPNLHRLRELKTKWDPDNFFHNNVNALPR